MGVACLTKTPDCNTLTLKIHYNLSLYKPSSQLNIDMQLLPSFHSKTRRTSDRAIRPALILALVCVALFSFLFLADRSFAKDETVYVKVLVARVRQAPTTESPILFRIRRGEAVVVKQAKDGWYRIQHSDGSSGWAHEKLFAQSAPQGGQTTEPLHFIKSVRLDTASPDRETVFFQLGDFHPPETFVLGGEKPRVVCDFMNTHIQKSIGARVETGGSLVNDIRIVPYGGVVSRVRIVLDLAADRQYEVDQTFYKKENLYVVSVKTTR